MSHPSARSRVGVVMGGWSGEHQVSLTTGAAVVRALKRRGYDALPIVVPEGPVGWGAEQRGGAGGLSEALRAAEIDVAFLALHGRFGEDGCVQGLLELEGIPYTGSGVLASALAMDKVKAKELFLLHNIPTPPYYTVSVEQDLADIEALHQHFGFPVIVKPRAEGSSLALTKAHSLAQLARALQRVFEFDDWALVERFVDGAEVTVGMLNGRVLGAIEVCPDSELYDYHAKYTSRTTQYFMPARLSAARYQGVLNLGARAAEVLDTTGGLRVDLLITPGENEYVLEVNTLPGLTETSLLPKIAEAAGYDFGDLCLGILQSARLHAPGRAAWDGDDDNVRRSGVVPTQRAYCVDDAEVVAKSA